jgi:hypothetical protein
VIPPLQPARSRESATFPRATTSSPRCRRSALYCQQRLRTPGRSRGTAPARRSAFFLETPCLRFAWDASVSGGAQLTTALDEDRASRLTLARRLLCSDKAVVWPASARAVANRPQRKPRAEVARRSHRCESTTRSRFTADGCGRDALKARVPSRKRWRANAAYPHFLRARSRPSGDCTPRTASGSCLRSSSHPSTTA